MNGITKDITKDFQIFIERFEKVEGFKYMDPNFNIKHVGKSFKRYIEDTNLDFHSKFWEMFLILYFLENGFKLIEKDRIDCPDIKLEIDNRYVFVEAVICNPGKDVLPRVSGKDTDEFERQAQISSRHLNVLSSKINQRGKFVDKGLVYEDDIYILAINDWLCQPLRYDYPGIVSTLFPIGCEELRMTTNKETGELEVYGSPYLTYEDEIFRGSNKSSLRKDNFLNVYYSVIDLVIYSSISIENIFFGRKSKDVCLNNKLEIVHNPCGSLKGNDIKDRIFPCVKGYFVISNESGDPISLHTYNGLISSDK